MELNITITAKNAEELDNFTPVSGSYIIGIGGDGSDPDRADLTREMIGQSVANFMAADYKIDVQIFRIDGREITGEIPLEGTFLATRARSGRGEFSFA